MYKTFLKPVVILCVAGLFFGTLSCSKKDEKKEEDPPPTPTPIVEKDVWKPFGSGTKSLNNRKWSFRISDKVYFGGDADVFQVFDLKNAVWDADLPLPAAFKKRISCAVTVQDGKAYIGGGDYGNQIFTDWWEFTPTATTPWKALAACPVQQRMGIAFIHNGTLYSGLSQGIINNQPIQSRFYLYNIATNTWNPNPLIGSAKCGTLGFGILLNNLFYFGAGQEETTGGVKQSFSCYTLNPVDNSFRIIADFPEPMLSDENAITFTGNGKIYVLMGGYALIQYDPASDKWKKMKNTPDEGGQNIMSYVHQSGEKVYGFLRNGKVYEYIYE